MKRETLYSLLGLLFVLSGGLGLIYQILWFKYLSLFLGNTTYAQTIVLATFMGGLAVGAAWWGRKADKLLKPLALYAWLELGIGLYCAFYPLLLPVLKSAFVLLVHSFELPSDSLMVLLLKLVVSLASLLPPTIFMGGTLPAMVRFFTHRVEESGKNVAVLYFLNSLGAVLGSILAGFFLIRIIGLNAATYSAAGVNLLVAGIAFILSKRTFISELETRQAKAETAAEFPDSQVKLAIITAGVSGFAAMIYEVTWVRLFIPVLGSSTYSFSIMLVSFISGITIGSLIVSRLVQRTKGLFKLLSACQIGVVLSMLLTLPFYARIPFYFWHVAHLLNRTDAGYLIFLSVQFIFAFLIMLVPTIFLGMTLPVATRIATKSLSVLGTSVGNVFSFNTLGTVLGSLTAGLVFLPLVGVKHTIEIGISLNVCMGIVTLLANPRIQPVRKAIYGVGVLCSIVLYVTFGGTWIRGLSLSGVFRLIGENVTPSERYEDFKAAFEKVTVFYYKEGTTATVAVYEGEFQREKQNILLINGKADASSVGDLPTQLLLAHLPLSLHPDPQTALVVGLGSGVTAGSALSHPLKRVDCVEISPEVVEASRYFDDVNRQPLDDPRFRLFIDDALAFLKLTPAKYDVIISEPTNPWIAGIGNLFTLEFFEECKKKLNPHGMMVQWFHLYEMDDEVIKLVLRTYLAVFPHVTLWQAQSTDIMIVGSTEETGLDFDGIDRRIHLQEVKEDLSRAMVDDAATLLSMQILSPRKVKEYAGAGDLNTEDRPRLEYKAPQVFFTNQGAKELPRVDERTNLGTQGILLAQRLEQKPLSDDELLRIGMLHTTGVRGNPVFGYTVLSEFIARHPKDIEPLSRLADVTEQMHRPWESLEYRKRLVELQPNNPDVLERYVWMKYAHERVKGNMVSGFSTREFEQLLNRSIRLAKDTVDRYRVRLADMFFGTQQYARAEQNYRRALQIRENHKPDSQIHQDVLLLQLARSLHHIGQTGKALGYAFQATQLNPHNEAAKDFIYAIWTNGGSHSADSAKGKL